MPTPKAGYWIDNVRVPSTTTITGRFKNADPLIWWAWNLGREGKDYREEKQKAADAGTAAHDMVEAFIRGRAFDPTPYSVDALTKGENAFSAFRRWADQCRLKPEKTELALVSRRFRYGGTIDAVAIEGQLRILDWKSSNGLYPDYLLQLAAYGQLWNENNPSQPVEGYDLVRFSKDDNADFAHHSFTSLNKELSQFLLFRKAYQNEQQLKKRI